LYPPDEDEENEKKTEKVKEKKKKKKEKKKKTERALKDIEKHYTRISVGKARIGDPCYKCRVSHTKFG